MCKILTSPKEGYQDLSMGFAGEFDEHAQECITRKLNGGKFHVRISLKDVLDFAENQE